MDLRADSAERLIAPRDAATPASRRRSLVPVALSLLVHASAVATLVLEQAFSPPPPRVDEEIPLEVVVETPPPAQEQTPPPEPEPEQEQPTPKEPPTPKIVDDETPAFDAPRAENRETVEREAPDLETKAARAAPPDDQTAPAPSPEKNPEPEQQSQTNSEPEVALQKAEENEQNAEIVERAETKPEEKQELREGKIEQKASPAPKKQQTLADQIASLAPVPDYRIGGASRPAPVSGGTAKTTYLSILFGMIMRKMHFPPRLPGRPTLDHGVVSFYVDERGHLVHQAVSRSSGYFDLDAAALAAVRRAAPFPAPPTGHPRGMQFHFSSR